MVGLFLVMGIPACEEAGEVRINRRVLFIAGTLAIKIAAVLILFDEH